MSTGETAHRVSAPWLLAAPALLLFIGIVLIPTAMTVLLSFHDWGQYKGIDPIITLKNWRDIATDSYFFEIFLRTFRIALIVTAISIVIGARRPTSSTACARPGAAFFW